MAEFMGEQSRVKSDPSVAGRRSMSEASFKALFMIGAPAFSLAERALGARDLGEQRRGAV